MQAVGDCDRLLILGDLLELRHGPIRDAMAAAREPLRALGTALGAEREVMIVPGNHDHNLLDAWIDRRGRNDSAPALGLEASVDWQRGEVLATIADWLGPARMTVGYPGVWLRQDVYATHGHYADMHLSIPTIERLGAGVMSRVVGLTGTGPRTTEQYEAALAPLYAWMYAVAQRVDPQRGGSLNDGSVRGWAALTGPRRRRDLRRRALALAYPALVAGLNRAGIGPFQSELTGPELRRAGLRGVEQACRRLGVSAAHVIFGHTHRAGPLPDDDLDEWRMLTGAQLVNSGCWVSEPAFLGPEPRRSPYRVGFAVRLQNGRGPELVNLLD